MKKFQKTLKLIAAIITLTTALIIPTSALAKDYSPTHPKKNIQNHFPLNPAKALKFNVQVDQNGRFNIRVDEGGDVSEL